MYTYKVRNGTTLTDMDYTQVKNFLSRRKYYNYNMVENIDARLLKDIIHSTAFSLDSSLIDSKVLLETINESNIYRLSNTSINKEFINGIGKYLLSKIRYSKELYDTVKENNLVIGLADIVTYPELVAYVDCENIILDALKLKPECCKYITYFTDTICDKVMPRYPNIFRYLKGDLNRKYAKQAVSVNGNLLQYVEEQTEEIVELAVLRHYSSIRFVKDRELSDKIRNYYTENKEQINRLNREKDETVLINCYEGYRYITELTPRIFNRILDRKDKNGIEFIECKFYKEYMSMKNETSEIMSKAM